MKTFFRIIVLSLLITFLSCEKDQIQINDGLNGIENRGSDEADGCETGFAYVAEGCFSEDGFRRWGWSIGPLSAPYKEKHEIYQAAGQCNLENGDLVGTLYVTYGEDNTVLVSFSAHEGYAFFETHLYIGNEKYPRLGNGRFTVAPGQYPYSNDIPEGTIQDDYLIENIEGAIYIIAHVVVCPSKKKEKPNR